MTAVHNATVTRSRRTRPPFSVIGPQQLNGSDLDLKKDARLTMLKRGRGYSQVKTATTRPATSARRTSRSSPRNEIAAGRRATARRPRRRRARRSWRGAGTRRRPRARQTAVRREARSRPTPDARKACPTDGPRRRPRRRHPRCSVLKFVPCLTNFTARVFVVGDNIDTDQIIPAQYLTLLPTVPEEYAQLGSYAMVGLPDGRTRRNSCRRVSRRTPYGIVIAGRNFGCGSSREHAPIALGAAGCRRWSRRATRASFSATAWPRARCSRTNRWTGCATCSRRATR